MLLTLVTYVHPIPNHAANSSNSNDPVAKSLQRPLSDGLAKGDNDPKYVNLITRRLRLERQ